MRIISGRFKGQLLVNFQAKHIRLIKHYARAFAFANARQRPIDSVWDYFVATHFPSLLRLVRIALWVSWFVDARSDWLSICCCIELPGDMYDIYILSFQICAEICIGGMLKRSSTKQWSTPNDTAVKHWTNKNANIVINRFIPSPCFPFQSL